MLYFWLHIPIHHNGVGGPSEGLFSVTNQQSCFFFCCGEDIYRIGLELNSVDKFRRVGCDDTECENVNYSSTVHLVVSPKLSNIIFILLLKSHSLINSHSEVRNNRCFSWSCPAPVMPCLTITLHHKTYTCIQIRIYSSLKLLILTHKTQKCI